MKIIGSNGPKRSRRIQFASASTAGFIVVMLLAQLFGYEDFAITLGALMPFSNNTMLVVTAAVVVLVELLALPYLLGMYLSQSMRIVSGVFSAIVSVFWLFTAFTNSHASNSGLFSTTFELPGGILATAWSLILFVGIVIVIRADTQAAARPLEKNA